MKVSSRYTLTLFLALVMGLFSSLALSGCLVAGVSSGGGLFIWPGSVGLVLLLLVLVFILRRR